MNKVLLIVNLGSPGTTNPPDVKEYLGEFLMDERVIDVPEWARSLLVKGIILNTRPKKSAKAYKKIWWEEGSPLIVLSERLADGVRRHTDLPVYLGMRYAEPSIAQVLRRMANENPDLDEILLLPMYPQYAMSSYETVVEKTRAEAEKLIPSVQLSVKKAFYDDPGYIKVLASSFKPHLDSGFDYFLMSYHGVPERHIRKCDITRSHCLKEDNCCGHRSEAHEFCYRHQCVRTTELVTEELGLDADKVSYSFQSRLGFDPWLKPFTDSELKRLGKAGTGKLVMACPAFTTDCLETLEEIQMEGAETFEENGGKHFDMIPCLNDNEDWAKLIADWSHSDDAWSAFDDVVRPDYLVRI